MRHARPITCSRMLSKAQTTDPTTTGGTPFESKINFLVNLVDRTVSWVLQKGSAL